MNIPKNVTYECTRYTSTLQVKLLNFHKHFEKTFSLKLFFTCKQLGLKNTFIAFLGNNIYIYEIQFFYPPGENWCQDGPNLFLPCHVNKLHSTREKLKDR